VIKAAATEVKKKSVPGVQMSLFFTNAPETKVAYEIEESVTPADVEQAVVATYKTIHDVKHVYEVVDTKEKRAALIKQLSQQKSFCFDTETTSTDPNNAELVGMSFSIKTSEGYYVPVPANQNEAEAIVTEFKTVFENEAI